MKNPILNRKSPLNNSIDKKIKNKKLPPHSHRETSHNSLGFPIWVWNRSLLGLQEH